MRSFSGSKPPSSGATEVQTVARKVGLEAARDGRTGLSSSVTNSAPIISVRRGPAYILPAPPRARVRPMPDFATQTAIERTAAPTSEKHLQHVPAFSLRGAGMRSKSSERGNKRHPRCSRTCPIQVRVASPAGEPAPDPDPYRMYRSGEAECRSFAIIRYAAAIRPSDKITTSQTTSLPPGFCQVPVRFHMLAGRKCCRSNIHPEQSMPIAVQRAARILKSITTSVFGVDCAEPAAPDGAGAVVRLDQRLSSWKAHQLMTQGTSRRAEKTWWRICIPISVVPTWRVRGRPSCRHSLARYKRNRRRIGALEACVARDHPPFNQSAGRTARAAAAGTSRARTQAEARSIGAFIAKLAVQSVFPAIRRRPVARASCNSGLSGRRYGSSP